MPALSRLLAQLVPPALLTIPLLLVPGLAFGATLRGTVVDPDGRAAPGARVLLSGPIGLAATAVTDDQGTFAMANLAAGPYDVMVALDGFRAEPLSVVLTADEERDVSIRLRLSPVSESVVVSASQVELPLSRATDSVTVITARELRAHQIDTVADALRFVPGLVIARSGTRGALTSIFPRGGESDFTLVLVDGMRLNSFGGGFDFGHLPVSDIERIEIVRGPQSAVFGSDAIGAVVQVVTRHGGRPRADVTLEGGSFSTTRLAGSTSGGHRGWSWGASLERLASDGYTGSAPATGEPVTNDDFRSTAASFSGGWRTDGGMLVRGDMRLGSSARGFPGPFGSDPAGLFGGVDRISRGEQETRLVTVGASRAFAGGLRTRGHITYADLQGAFASPFGESESGTRRVSVRLQADLAVRPWTGTSIGVELQGERAHSTFITGERHQPIPIRRRIAGYFAEQRMTPVQRLAVTAGVRLEQIRRERMEADPSPFTDRPAFASETLFSLNPRVSMAYDLQPENATGARTRLRAGAGTGIRAPDALEIAFTDNPGLRPERSRSVEAGIEQTLPGSAIVLQATAFHNRYVDLIVAVGRALQDASRFRTDNIANARAQGLELAATGRVARGLEVRAGYTFLDTAVLSVDGLHGQAPAPFAVGDSLIRRPRHQASVDVTVSRDRLTAFAHVGVRGRTLDIEPSFGTFGGLFQNPGWAVANGGAAWRLTPQVEAFAHISNLLERRYEETLGFPALGRSAMVGVRLAARR
jgi:outer membrane cobalamin receptor